MNPQKQTQHTPGPFAISEFTTLIEDLHDMGAAGNTKIAMKDGERVQWLVNERSRLVAENEALKQGLTRIQSLAPDVDACNETALKVAVISMRDEAKALAQSAAQVGASK